MGFANNSEGLNRESDGPVLLVKRLSVGGFFSGSLLADGVLVSLDKNCSSFFSAI